MLEAETQKITGRQELAGANISYSRGGLLTINDCDYEVSILMVKGEYWLRMRLFDAYEILGDIEIVQDKNRDVFAKCLGRYMLINVKKSRATVMLSTKKMAEIVGMPVHVHTIANKKVVRVG